MRSPTTEDLSSVFVVDASDAWITGSEGSMLRWTGTEWVIWQTVTTGRAGEVWLARATEGWATAGDRLLRWDGSSWQLDGTVRLETFGSFSTLWGAADDDVWLGGGAVSPASQILGHWDGERWVLQADITEQPISISSIHGSSSDNIWGVMHLGRLIRHRGEGWAYVAGPEEGTITDVWVTSHEEAWFSALYGYVHRYVNGTWQVWSVGDDMTYDYAIWAASSDDVWVMGYQGHAAHWDGTAWTTHAVGEGRSVYAIHGSCAAGVWAVGEGGTILRLRP
ncbi:MAG: hypothetical protein AB2A00_04090 [Myxococcota bacterium]